MEKKSTIFTRLKRIPKVIMICMILAFICITSGLGYVALAADAYIWAEDGEITTGSAGGKKINKYGNYVDQYGLSWNDTVYCKIIPTAYNGFANTAKSKDIGSKVGSNYVVTGNQLYFAYQSEFDDYFSSDEYWSTLKASLEGGASPENAIDYVEFKQDGFGYLYKWTKEDIRDGVFYGWKTGSQYREEHPFSSKEESFTIAKREGFPTKYQNGGHLGLPSTGKVHCQWQYLVTYNVADASNFENFKELNSDGHAHGSYFTVSSEKPIKEGYVFTGWIVRYVNAKTSSTCNPGARIYMIDDIELEAQFEQVVTPPPTEAPDEPITPPPPTEAPDDTPHECTYGDWKHDSLKHWKECTNADCSSKTEESPHSFVKTSVDDGTNSFIETCEVCGYSKNGGNPIHQHSWSDWCPTYWWSAHLDENEWHWKFCTYCDTLGQRGPHIAEEEPSLEWGYYITRCQVCDWIMNMEPITITLTLHPAGGHFSDGSTEPISFEVQYDSLTTLWKLPTEYWPELDGKTFTGWYYITMEGEGCVYTPDYTTETCTGNSGYFNNNGDGTYSSRLTKDYTLYAQWQAAEYTVLYDSNGTDGLMFPSYYKIGESRALSLNGYYKTTKLTYNGGGVPCNIETNLNNTNIPATFLGWSKTANGPVEFTDGQVVTDLLSKSGVITLYAQFDYGTILLPNAIAESNGHRLIGWRTSDGTVISVVDSYGAFKNTTYNVTKDESFTAVWEANYYTVSFDSDGGTSCQPIEVEYGQAYNYNNSGLPKTTKTGYTFIGWKNTVTGEMIYNDTVVKTPSNHTLKAIWEIKSYKVQLDYNFNYGGKAVSPKKNSSLTALNDSVDEFTKTYGAAVGTLPTPERNGYTFGGWYTHKDSSGNGCGESGCVPSTITNDIVLYARWNLSYYTVTYDANGGSVSPTTATVTYNVKYGTLPTPSRTGYDFAGWYTADTGELVTADTIMLRMDNHTLKATWKAKGYTLTFDWNFDYKKTAVNSAKNFASDTMTINYDDYYSGLPVPTRDGYSFAGWYNGETDENGSGTKITDTTKMTTAANHTLYAKWVQNTYTVTFDYNLDYSVWED